jgi:biotin carboxyl carrier protein
MINYNVDVGGKKYDVLITDDGKISLNGKSHDLPRDIGSSSHLTYVIDNRTVRIFIQRISENEYEVWIKHYNLHIIIEDDRYRLLQQLRRTTVTHSGTLTIKAPMPGLVTTIKVQLDQVIEIGNGLLTLEAMKMENEIRSPVQGKIRSIDVVQKMVVEKNQPLMKIDII